MYIVVAKNLLKRQSNKKAMMVVKEPRKSWTMSGCTSVVVFCLLVTMPPFVGGSAQVPCTSTADCLVFGPSTVESVLECIDGFCINPFSIGGCLQQRMPGWNRTRVCTSQDGPEMLARGYCRKPAKGLDYMEIRIAAQNWESSVFATWVLQILLSEMVDVPVTVETGLPDKVVDFYDAKGLFQFGEQNVFRSLKRDQDSIDCRDVSTFNKVGGYEPCAHAIMEVWVDSNQKGVSELIEDGFAEPTTGLGALGASGWYIPKFTAENDPTLLTYLGLKGEANRRKLAAAFLRPTTWKTYCDVVSNTSCLVPDDVAKRPPRGETEYHKMFVDGGLYTGHFRKTEKNDCDRNPNCTGHFADYPCGWSSYFEPQRFHLDIPLDADHSDLTGERYTYQQLLDMIHAANVTKSNIMVYWWRPHIIHQTYRGTPSEMFRISLPSVTQSCLDGRINSDDRCLPDLARQRGESVGSCDEAPQRLQKVIASSLFHTAYGDNILAEQRSPAYDILTRFEIDDLNFGEFFESWFEGDLDPREAACHWFIDNFDHLSGFIPKTYPRIVEPAKVNLRLSYIASIAGIIALVLSIGSIVLFTCYRKHRIVTHAQAEFLTPVLSGILMVAIGALLNLSEASTASCLGSLWLISSGYIMWSVPLITKLALANRLLQSAVSYRRLVIIRKTWFRALATVQSLHIMYLLIWALFDPRERQAQFDLTDYETDTNEHIVHVNYYCDSNSRNWMIISYGLVFFLTACATIFAIITRTYQEDNEECKAIARMVYSRLFFSTIGGSISIFISQMILNQSERRLQRVIFYALDTSVALAVYIVPKYQKLVSAREEEPAEGGGSVRTFQSSGDQVVGSLQFGDMSSSIRCRLCGNFANMNPSERHLEDVIDEEDSDDNSSSSLDHPGKQNY